MKVFSLIALLGGLVLSVQSQALTIPAQPSKVQVYFENSYELAASIDSKEVVKFAIDSSCPSYSDCGNAAIAYANAVLAQATALSQFVLIDTAATDVTGLVKPQNQLSCH